MWPEPAKGGPIRGRVQFHLPVVPSVQKTHSCRGTEWRLGHGGGAKGGGSMAVCGQGSRDVYVDRLEKDSVLLFPVCHVPAFGGVLHGHEPYQVSRAPME